MGGETAIITLPKWNQDYFLSYYQRFWYTFMKVMILIEDDYKVDWIFPSLKYLKEEPKTTKKWYNTKRAAKRKDLQVTLSKVKAPVTAEDVQNEKDCQILANMVNLDRRNFDNDLAFVTKACKVALNQKHDSLSSVNIELKQV